MNVISINRVQDYKNGKSLKPKRGPTTNLTEADEKKMATYVNESWQYGCPFEKDSFAKQVTHYMQCNDIPNKFPNIYPGKLILLYIIYLHIDIVALPYIAMFKPSNTVNLFDICCFVNISQCPVESVVLHVCTVSTPTCQLRSSAKLKK